MVVIRITSTIRCVAICRMWLVLATSLAAATAAPSAPGPIIDPYSNEDFSCDGKPDGRLYFRSETYGYGRFRILADLNFDGRQDIILTTAEGGCASSGCPAAIYLKQTDLSYSRSELWLHPEAVDLARGESRGGKLITYSHSTADDGFVETYSVTDDAIIQTSQTRVFTDRNNGNQGQTSASHGSHLYAEYARCRDGTLEWSSSYK